MTSKITITADYVSEGNHVRVELVQYPVNSMACGTEFGKVTETHLLESGETATVNLYTNTIVSICELDKNPDLDW